MYSLAFPKMFSTARTNLIKDKEATLTNLKLLLASNQGGLLGDPQFGTVLTKMLFEQNDDIIKELVIEEIHTAIETFLPQLKVKLEDIDVTTDGKDTVFIKIKGINVLDYQLDTYEVALVNGYEKVSA